MSSSFKTFSDKFDALQGRLSFNMTARRDLYEMIASMVSDGLPLDDCLRKLAEYDTKYKQPLASMLRKWVTLMSEGVPFQDAIKDEVPAQERALIASGMLSNDPVTGLRQAIFVVNGRSRLIGALGESLTYPAVLFLLLIGIIVGVSMGVLPAVAKVVPPEKWGPKGQMLYAFGRGLASWGPVVVAGAVALVGVLAYSIPRWAGRGRALCDKVMPWNIYRMFSASMFLLSLSSMLKAGTPLGEAIRQIRAVSSPWVRSHLAVMQRRLAAGKNYEAALDTGMLDREQMRQVSIYSQLTEFDKAIKDIGERAIDSTILKVKKQAGILRILAFLAVGVTIATVFAILQLDIFSSIGRPSVPGARP